MDNQNRDFDFHQFCAAIAIQKDVKAGMEHLDIEFCRNIKFMFRGGGHVSVKAFQKSGRIAEELFFHGLNRFRRLSRKVAVTLCELRKTGIDNQRPYIAQDGNHPERQY